MSPQHSLQKCKPMNAASYVDKARSWARELEEDVAKGRSLEWARYELEQRTGLPPNLFWSLRHRPPKRIAADIYFRLRAAYYDHCARVLADTQRRMSSDLDADLLAQAESLSQEIAAQGQ